MDGEARNGKSSSGLAGIRECDRRSTAQAEGISAPCHFYCDVQHGKIEYLEQAVIGRETLIFIVLILPVLIRMKQRRCLKIAAKQGSAGERTDAAEDIR